MLLVTALGAAAWRQAEVWSSIRASWRSDADVLTAHATTAAWTLATRLEAADAMPLAPTMPLPRSAEGALLPPAVLAGLSSCAALRVAVQDTRGATRMRLSPCGDDSAPPSHVISQTATVARGPFLGWRVAVHPTAALATVTRRAHGRGGWIVLLTTIAVTAGAAAMFVLLDLRRSARVARDREEFVTAVSHDLRTPLAHIAVMAETLRLARHRSPEEGAYLLTVIGREADRLRVLVDRVVAFAAAERGATTLAPEPTDLVEHATHAAEMARRLAPPETRFHVVEPDGETWVLADRVALGQVLDNLLDNAVRYGPAVQCVRLTATRDGRTAVLTIDDEGPGIPVADRAAVFRPFVRGRSALDTAGGAGLGLALVADLVRRMRGTVTIAAAPGGGARIVVRLPAVDVDDARVPVRRESRPDVMAGDDVTAMRRPPTAAGRAQR